MRYSKSVDISVVVVNLEMGREFTNKRRDLTRGALLDVSRGIDQLHHLQRCWSYKKKYDIVPDIYEHSALWRYVYVGGAN